MKAAHRVIAAGVLVTWLLVAARPVAAEWNMVYEQDFRHGAALDLEVWSHETGFHRNREQQFYAASNVFVQGGALVIEARREAVPNPAYRAGSRDWRSARREAAYTSGSIVSRRPLHYGRVEVVARSPVGAGVWPAIWLLHESAGQYGEIDIFEAVGKHPDTVFAAIHHGRDARSRRHHGASRHRPGLDGQWHTHSLAWTPSRIAVAVDGEPLLDFDPADAARQGIDPLRRPMHLRINLALGGNWAGPVDDARLPARFEIAAIRIFGWQPGGTPSPAAAAPAPQDRAVPDGPAPAAAQAPAGPDPVPPPPPFRWGR